jgi:cytochrome P450
MPSPNKSLPPGSAGLPLLGETLTFLKDGFGFVEERARRYGPVFRTRILGRNAAVIVGPTASGEFINSDHVQREGAMLPHIQTLFGGRCLPVLDGPEHRERKQFVMAAFTEEALASYLPIMSQTVRRYCERWASGKELRWLDEFKRLSLEVICETILGMSPGPVMDRINEDYERVGAGFSHLPIPLPGTAYTRAKKALGRILAVFETSARDHIASPRADGLSRILAQKSTTSGQTITVDEVKVELHHVIVAGLIVWAWFISAVLELERNPAQRDRLRDEVRRLAPDGQWSLERLGQMKELQRFTMEVRRLSPVVHVFFGKARQAFDFNGYTIPAGWMVLWGHRSSHLREETYATPERFDPSRFSPPRSEHLKHPHGFVPNGAGSPAGHKCAGYEFAPVLLQVFVAELVSKYRWEWVQPQDLSYDWSKIPPAPKDGLKVRLSPLPVGEGSR